MAEQRPFAKGERVYVLWENEEPGKMCVEGYVVEDDGGDAVIVVLVTGPTYRLPADRIRRDRRGRDRRGSQPPVYEEVLPTEPVWHMEIGARNERFTWKLVNRNHEVVMVSRDSWEKREDAVAAANGEVAEIQKAVLRV